MNSSEQAVSQSSQSPVGIDLGTTFSVLAYVDDANRPVTVSNSVGDLITPSAVFVDDDEVIVGREAVRNAAESPDSYAECFKRDMGSPRFRRRIRGLDVPPEVLSAFVLERLKNDAQRRIGPIQKVVITVPAFFDETRRRATQDAGRLAGLEVLDIINEPTAAALAYGYQRGFLKVEGGSPPERQRVLVYDLGGGTFDVTILEIDGSRFHAIATDGDVFLGGKDFDEQLVNHLAQHFINAHGVDPRSDPQDAAQLWLDAQDAKHALSERNKTTVTCFHAGIRMRIEVARSTFEELTRSLLERTEATTSLVLSEAHLDWSQIDRVLLVGGSSRMPMVGQMLRKLSGKEPDCSQSPDEAVAQGAALYAAMLSAEPGAGSRPTCELINVNSHSLGVVGINSQTHERANAILIPKNSSLPCRAMKVFHTAKAGQRSVRIPVVEGESHRPEDCISLGECIIRELPPGLPPRAAIEVEYRYETNGRISVSARVPCVRYSAHLEITPNGSHDLADLEVWRPRLLGKALAVGKDGAASPGLIAVDLNDHASALKRLDTLYEGIGMAAMRTDLPLAMQQSRRVAAEAAAALARVQANLQQAGRARQAAGAGHDSLRLDAQIAQLKTELQQVQMQAVFAHLVLGRECMAASVHPPGTDEEIEEIQRLQHQLAG